ncbi:MAG: response regulator [Woeseiaceae bacterium]
MSKTKILVVDDNLELLQIINDFLIDNNYDVVCCEDGEQAIEKNEAFDAEIILTDIVMPKIDGIELLVKMKKKQPELYIIVMSGGNRGHADNYLHMASDLGANAVLHKPFALAKLLEKIENR